jgi:hypothetical protein
MSASALSNGGQSFSVWLRPFLTTSGYDPVRPTGLPARPGHRSRQAIALAKHAPRTPTGLRQTGTSWAIQSAVTGPGGPDPVICPLTAR